MPLRRTYDQTCSLASALEVVGERWSLLIVRDLLFGLHRFDELQEDLGIARNVLQTRLARLVEAGVVEKRLYQQRPPRHGYHLTERGLDLWLPVVGLMAWGDRHAARPAGPPVLIRHRDCGGVMDDHMLCAECRAPLGPANVVAVAGPGADPTHPLRRREAQALAAAQA
jgi:DNA-binding HxlR family transcriptional regulator